MDACSVDERGKDVSWLRSMNDSDTRVESEYSLGHSVSRKVKDGLVVRFPRIGDGVCLLFDSNWMWLLVMFSLLVVG